MSGTKTLVIHGGNLIDGSGKPTAANDAIVVEGNRIKSVGPLPPEVRHRGSATSKSSMPRANGSCPG